MKDKKNQNSNFFWWIGYSFITFSLIGLVGASIRQLPNLNSSYSVEQFFPTDHPLLTVDQKIKKTFDLEEEPPLILVLHKSNGENWLRSDKNFQLARSLTDGIQERLTTAQITSITNIEIGKVFGQETVLGKVDEIFPGSQLATGVQKHKLLTPHLVSQDQKWLSIIIQPSEQTNTHFKDLIEQANSYLQSYRDQIQWTWAGVPAVQSSLTDGLAMELGRFLILTHVLFSLVFLLFFKGWKTPLIAVASLVGVNVIILAVCAVLGVAMTVLLVTLPILVSLTFVSLLVHTLFAWAKIEHPTHLIDRIALAFQLLRGGFLPNFLSAGTTAIGFAVLAASPIPAIKTYALIVALAVMVTFVLSMLIMFLLLPHLKVEMRSWSHRQPVWLLKALRFRELIVIVSAGFVTMGFVSIFFVPFSSRLFDDLPQGDQTALAMQRLDHSFGGTVPLSIKVATPFRNAWHDPSALRQLDRVVQELRGVKGVGSVIALTDFLPLEQRSTRAKVAENLFLFSMSAANPLRAFLDKDAKAIRISLRLQDRTSQQIEATRKEIEAIVGHRFPKGHVIEAGLAINSHLINQEVAKSLVYGFWQSMFIITLLLAFIFKSWRWALVAAVPNLLPPAVLLLAMAVAQTPIKPGVALVFSIALGLAFNNTIYLLSALRDQALDLGRKVGPSGRFMNKVMLKEGMPCLSESLIAFVGFTVFLASEFQVNQTFGMFMLLSILAGILGDLLLLPAFVKLFPTSLDSTVLRKPPGLAEKFKKFAASIALFFAFGFTSLNADVAFANQAPAAKDSSESIETILKRIGEKMRADSEEGYLKLLTWERNQDERVQSVYFRGRQTKNGGQALIKVLTPKDLAGTRILATVEDGKEKQWLYNPKTKQTRRLVTGKSSGGLFGSEFATRDLNLEVVRATKARILSRANDEIRVQLIPIKKKATPFTQAELFIDAKTELPIRMTYFIGKKEVKVFRFIKYHPAQGGRIRPAILEVTNRTNGRKSRVEYSEVKLNRSYDDSLFTLRGLRSEKNH